ncbi:Uncharacterised protein [Mycobacteroides abscessus subsp. abscessus]|nr:Uncharacterised protein [Mycobacteroides abscessus subsp. abscessus]
MRQPISSLSPIATTLAKTEVMVVVMVSFHGNVVNTARCGWALSSR